MHLRPLLVPTTVSLGLLLGVFACGGQVDGPGGSSSSPSPFAPTGDPRSTGARPCGSSFAEGACTPEGDRCFTGTDRCSYREYECRGGYWSLGVHNDPGTNGCSMPCMPEPPTDGAACSNGYGSEPYTCVYPGAGGCSLRAVCERADAGMHWTTTTSCPDAGAADAASD